MKMTVDVWGFIYVLFVFFVFLSICVYNCPVWPLKILFMLLLPFPLVMMVVIFSAVRKEKR